VHPGALPDQVADAQADRHQDAGAQADRDPVQPAEHAEADLVQPAGVHPAGGIQLDLASLPASRPGGEVLVQATTEAQRGTDTYAVPHAGITFSIASQPGAGAFVDPAQADSGDTGVAVVTVQTSDQPGDTVVHAVSGSASTDFTVHADPPTPSPVPQRTPKPAVVGVAGTGSGGGPRPLMVAGLSALLAAVVGGYGTALALGRLPNPLQRRVWGRRSAR
jgi:hypothetical protein